MCVIIHRKPGITIPFEKLASACFVNADGMGIAVPDRGKLELRKFFNTKGNDPEVLAKLLEEAKDLDVYVHLRYRTKGRTDKDNVHPFGVLTKKKHGTDIQFMHNGTLSDFGTDKSCDSKMFAKTFLQPLSEKFLKAMEPEEIIHDPIYCSILEKYAGKGSVFLLVDNHGGNRIINYDNGKEFAGWWASNDYSFNRYHREKDDGPNYYSSRWYRDADGYRKERVQSTGAPNKVVTLPPVPAKDKDVGGTAKPPFNDEVPFDTAKKEAAKEASGNPMSVERTRFIDVAGLTKLSDITQLTRQHVEDLVDEYPENAVLLILDLVKELYDRDMELDDSAYGEAA